MGRKMEETGGNAQNEAGPWGGGSPGRAAQLSHPLGAQPSPFPSKGSLLPAVGLLRLQKQGEGLLAPKENSARVQQAHRRAL